MLRGDEAASLKAIFKLLFCPKLKTGSVNTHKTKARKAVVKKIFLISGSSLAVKARGSYNLY